MKKALLPRLAVGILILASLIVIAGFAPPDGEEEKPLPSDFDVEPTLTYDAFFKLADAAGYELSPKGTPRVDDADIRWLSSELAGDSLHQ